MSVQAKGMCSLLACTLALVAVSTVGATATWLAPQTIDPAGGSDPVLWSSPKTRMLLAAWVSSEGRIRAAEHPAGGGWSSPEFVSPAGEVASNPALLGDDAHAQLVWIGDTGAGNRVRAAELPFSSMTWGSPFNLSDPASTLSPIRVRPVVDSGKGFSAAVVWQAVDMSAQRWIVGSHRSVQSSIWSQQVALGPGIDPSVAVSPPNGEIVLAWSVFDQGRYVVMLSDEFNPPTALSVGAAGEDATHSSVNLSSLYHDTVLLWQFAPGGVCCVIQARTRQVSGVWKQIRTISDPSIVSYRPTAAGFPGDGPIAAYWWAVHDADNQSIQARNGSAYNWWSPILSDYPVGSLCGFCDPPQLVFRKPAYVVLGTWQANDLTIHVFTQDCPHLTVATSSSAPQAFVTADRDGEAAFVSTNTPLQVEPCDSAPPRLHVKIPTSGTVGVRKTFWVNPRDTWSAIDPPVWDFGDGTGTQTGRKVSHIYSVPGTYTVTVTDSDAVGNTATVRKAITISS